MKVALVESTALWNEAIHAVLREAGATIAIQVASEWTVGSCESLLGGSEPDVLVGRGATLSAVHLRHPQVPPVDLDRAPATKPLLWLAKQLSTPSQSACGTTTSAVLPKQPWLAPLIAVMPPTERELAIVRGIAAGKSNVELARELGIGQSTVTTHRRRLYKKWGVHTAGQAVETARARGLLNSATISGSEQRRVREPVGRAKTSMLADGERMR